MRGSIDWFAVWIGDRKEYRSDASQLENRQVKVNLRNVSGDTAYDMRSLKGQLEDVLRAKGYKPADGDDYSG